MQINKIGIVFVLSIWLGVLGFQCFGGQPFDLIDFESTSLTTNPTIPTIETVSSSDTSTELSSSSTTSSEPIDDTPPVISNVRVIDISNNAATITWETDEPATSRVVYLGGTPYVYTEELSGYTQTHSIPLSDLDANTVYHYRIFSTNEAGLETISPDYVFYTGDCALCGIQEEPDPILINPVIGNERSFYPSVIYDINHFENEIDDPIKTEGGVGTATYQVEPYYKAWYGNNSSPRNTNFAYSEDGIHWYYAEENNEGIDVFPSPPGGYHPCALYHKDGWMSVTGEADLDYSYLIWTWDIGSKMYLYGSNDGVTMTEIIGSSSSAWSPSGPGAVYSMYVLYDEAETDPAKRFKVWGDGHNGYLYYAHSDNAKDWIGEQSVKFCTDTCVDPVWETTLSSDFNIGDPTFEVADMDAISYDGQAVPIKIGSEEIRYKRANLSDDFFTVVERGYNATVEANHSAGAVITQATFSYVNGGCSVVWNDASSLYEIWYSTNIYGKGLVTGGYGNKGISYAQSTNGYEWTPVDYIEDSGQTNPILSTADGLNPNRNPAAPVFDGYTYTPWVLYDPNSFSGHGEYREYKMWFTGGDGGSSSRRVFYLSFDGAD